MQRHDTMSLDIVRPKDIPKGKVMYVKEELMSLKTDDLHKAQPHYEHLKYLNKPDFSVGCTEPDHAGGAARSYYPPMDRRPRDLSLTTADIELAQSKNKSWKGNRHTDPVCPNYELPSHVRREATPPRWNGRHTNDTSDIEQSRSRVLHPERNYRRDPNDGRDIEFSTANYRERMQRQSTQGPRQDRAFDVRDITQPKGPPARTTCPLDPVYTVPTSRTTSLHAKYNEEHALGVQTHDVQAEEHGHVHGSKPRKLQWDNGEPQFSLVREDIAGAVPQRWVGSVPQNIYDAPEVRHMMSFHDPCDIPGAQVGSLRKGIATGRVMNPLNPRYTMLDGDQKPHAVPVIEAERQQPGSLAHPLVRSQAAASSLPNLRSAGAATLAHGALQRDGSDAQLRRGGGSNYGSSRPSRAPSSHGTPQHYQGGPSGHQLMQQGVTIRLPAEGVQSGEMSRRSSAYSSHREFGPGYGRG